MQKRAVIIHGWGASPSDHWFPWLSHELEAQGFAVSVPAMPDTDHPDKDAWVSTIRDTVGTADEGLILVGHSIGTVAILRYLESLPSPTRVAGAVLVAGFLEADDAELATFFSSPFDCERIKSTCGAIIAIEGDDDPHVLPGSGALIRDTLGAKLITLHEAGHMNAEDGFTTLPSALEAIRSLFPIVV